jgi:hypothetical protein
MATQNRPSSGLRSFSANRRRRRRFFTLATIPLPTLRRPRRWGFTPYTSSRTLKRQLEQRHYASDALCQALLAPEQVQHTLARSAALRRRLIAHLQQALQLQPGDTLMLIDLGYSGTTQNLLAGLLEKALSIQVRGCYLIAAWVPGWRKNRTAMIDPDRAEYRTIRALTQFITPFEMLCSSHARSVVDYSATGEPVTEGDPLPPNEGNTPLFQRDSVLHGGDIINFTAGRPLNFIGEPSVVLFRTAALRAT